jgi:RsiW-degrading membrane proteinase PrsW (M82 family)
MGLIVSLLLGFLPTLFFAYIVYWLDRYEKEPRLLLGGAFIWGTVIAAGAAFVVNTVLGVGIYVLTGSELATNLTTGSIIAPIVEESLKGLAVLVVFIIFYKEFDSILDGIIYAAVTALGFAATENSYYIFVHGFQKEGWSGLFVLAFIRIILVGWQHPFYTAFIGIGLAIARLNRKIWVRTAAPVAGWFLAVSAHSLHNTIASFSKGISGLAFGTIIDWTGWFFMFLLILWMINREKQRIILYLREETTLGIISGPQYKTACSDFRQSLARVKSLFSHRYRQTSRFYQVCGELSHKKHQLATLGDERGNTKAIDHLRAEMALLAPLALD